MQQETETGQTLEQAKADQRAARARTNGAKSLGPTSPEGKATSSRNSLTHGFAAKINVLIAPDDSAAWDEHITGYHESYLPTNYAESDMVDELASISWRKSRLVATETALIDFQLSVQELNIDQNFPDEAGNPNLHLALAWQGLARSPLPRQNPSTSTSPSTPPSRPTNSTSAPSNLSGDTSPRLIVNSRCWFVESGSW